MTNKANENELQEVAEFQESYVTRREFNDEVKLRVDGDKNLMDQFNSLRKTNREKFNDVEDKIANNGENIKTHEERIVDLEETFREQIKRLESEKNNLTSELDQAQKNISNQAEEIKKLRGEIENNDDYNHINLRFLSPPEFIISEVISVKEFINQHLKDLVVERMNIRYPETEFNKDYTLTLHGLAYNDIMQGKYVTVVVSALNSGKLVGESSFKIKIIYDYDANQQEKFLEEFLQVAIPVSLINVPENATPDYNLPKEIVNTKPLKLLLENTNFQNLSFKIFGEMNASSYWTDFQRSWQFIKSGYNGTGQSTIGGSKVINNIRDLYDNTSGYYHNIFQLIAQRINDSGVPCVITKKWVHNSLGDWLMHTLGNLTFNVTNTNLENDDVTNTTVRHYYLMVNFELVLSNQVTKFYRGVTLALTDKLELY